MTIPLTDLNSNEGRIRAYVAVINSDTTAEDVLATTNGLVGGPSIIRLPLGIPTLSPLSSAALLLHSYWWVISLSGVGGSWLVSA